MLYDYKLTIYGLADGAFDIVCFSLASANRNIECLRMQVKVPFHASVEHISTHILLQSDDVTPLP